MTHKDLFGQVQETDREKYFAGKIPKQEQ